jgi:hypothetical protein
LPACVPLHWNAAGLPIGTQFVARLGEDALLFRLAGQIERAQPWFDRVPNRCRVAAACHARCVSTGQPGRALRPRLDSAVPRRTLSAVSSTEARPSAFATGAASRLD